MEDQKLVLDVSGKDRAAISVMHAYMRARGLDPDDLLPEGRDFGTAPRITPSLRARWLEAAQELADNPDPECSTGCLATESMLWVLDEEKPYHPSYKHRSSTKAVAVVVRYKDSLS